MGQLHRLRIGYSILPYVLRVPWTQMTDCRLQAEFFAFDDCLGVLGQATNITTYCGCKILLDTRSLILLPRLHTLQINMG